MVGARRPLVPEILNQNDPVLSRLQPIAGKTRFRNDLLCVELDIKLYAMTLSLMTSRQVSIRQFASAFAGIAD